MIFAARPCALAVMTFPTSASCGCCHRRPLGLCCKAGSSSPYLVFFACGWLLWRNADLLFGLARFPGPDLSDGRRRRGIRWLCDLVLAAVDGNPSAPRVRWQRLFLALAMWLFIFGFIGSSPVIRRRSRGSATFSDSSYWLYLVHMAVLLVFQMPSRKTGWMSALKYIGRPCASVATLLGSYHVLVRRPGSEVVLNAGHSHQTPAPAAHSAAADKGKGMWLASSRAYESFRHARSDKMAGRMATATSALSPGG